MAADPRDYVAAEIAAAAGDVDPVTLWAAPTFGHLVAIEVDSHTARVLADGWRRLHESDDVAAAQRPRWHDDYVRILSAAAAADGAAGRVQPLPPNMAIVPIPTAAPNQKENH